MAAGTRIFLSGPMGAGKTTVAREVAARAGLTAVDLDRRVEERAGASVAEIFRGQGEAAFRQLEREEALRAADERDVVVALGGGTVVDREVRRRLLACGTLVTLDAQASVLAARVMGEQGAAVRPLLGVDPARVLAGIIEARRDAYAECHGRIDTSAASPSEIAERVIELSRDQSIAVPLGERSYVVEVGSRMLARVAERAVAASSGEQVVLVTDAGAARWASEAAVAVEGAGRTVTRVELARGEEHKTLAAVERIWDAALGAGIDRGALVLAVGGGVVGDVAGLAASTLLRGVALGQVPTTLLAMVDSSVGGKTGIDRAQGKNLVGTFHQPRFVLCDPDVLATLGEAERRAGLAEVVKAAWIAGEDDVAALEQDAAALGTGDTSATTRAIRRAVATKARIVSDDEREAGARRLLNLGHTVGHALEAAAGYRGLRHGEAVALGLVAALRVGCALGVASTSDAERATALLRVLRLPVDLDARFALAPDWARFLATDKKRAGSHVRFVVPGAPGRVEVVAILPAEVERLVTALQPGFAR